MWVFNKIKEFYRDKTMEKLRESFRVLGIDARFDEPGPEDADSIGRIDIRRGPVRWIRVLAYHGWGLLGGLLADCGPRHGICGA